jgi:predicted RecB family nuclease
MATRYDVSAVPLQGGYVAKQCPVRAQNDALRPVDPLPVSAVVERRFRLGREFEAEVFAQLVSAGNKNLAVIDRGLSTDGRVAQTAAVLVSGVGVVIGGRLPADEAGRRVGEPDLLVRSGEPVNSHGRWGYRPVDVKHHQVLSQTGALDAWLSDLDAPSREEAALDEATRAKKHRGDVLQLAHYHRLLEACGHAPAQGVWGGIVGKERKVAWFDLEVPMWRAPSSEGRMKDRTTLEIYDFEFDFRLDIIAVAADDERRSNHGLLVVPVRTTECAECPWWEWCRTQLAEAQDISLLSGIGWREWRTHRDHGIRTSTQLAALDHRTAQLVASDVDVPSYLDRADGAPPHSPVATLHPKRQKHNALLVQAGIREVGDLSLLDERTAAYSGTMSGLADQIDMARLVLSGNRVARRRGIAKVTVPRADVEVDIDMENIDDGVYLWGALVTDRSASGLFEPVYHPFVSWEAMNPEVELAVLSSFWEWFTDLRGTAQTAGLSLLSYYWSSVETVRLRSISAGSRLAESVEGVVTSPDWIDLLPIVRAQLLTTAGHGLKHVAGVAGFVWEDDDPGGAQSMLWYDEAVNGLGPSQTAARERLLAYNRNDVEATLAVRDWIDRCADGFPSVEDMEPTTRSTI